MHYYCNPLNITYKYQLANEKGRPVIYRESADPSLVFFKGKYLLFPTKAEGFYTSDNMVDWEYHPFRKGQLPDGYNTETAPDVETDGEYLYYCASGTGKNSSFFRTKDVFSENFEEFPGTFGYVDPKMFCDDDGRMYFYWGCSIDKPTFGIELDKKTFKPIGEPVALIPFSPETAGFERYGENHSMQPKKYTFNEGSWMTKHNGKYYLQYATPGTEFNVYGDGVYVSDKPLGPFKMCESNPYSYCPAGFITAAGHGSTLADANGEYWHISTMRISINHMFERRLGLWRAGFDKDGVMYCDQRYADWPRASEDAPFTKPRWMPLHLTATAAASSGDAPEKGISEDIRSWWTAGSADYPQWLQADLGACKTVNAVQINFADEGLTFDPPCVGRWVDTKTYYTRWKLEGSVDGADWFVIADKSNANSDLSHDFVVDEKGFTARYIRLTVYECGYKQPVKVSGLRIFGSAPVAAPAKAAVSAERIGPFDLNVSWTAPGALGANVLWGIAPDKLYHSALVSGKNAYTIGALQSAQDTVYLRVDTFNEGGITEGDVFSVTAGERK